jgi:hypothetical protein
LQGFQKNGRHGRAIGFAGVEEGLEGVRIVVREVAEPLHQRLKSLVIAGLAGGGDRRQCPPVKAGLSRENQGPGNSPCLMAMLPGQLDGGLIGFGTRVAEEHAIRTTALRQSRCQLFLFGDAIKV